MSYPTPRRVPYFVRYYRCLRNSFGGPDISKSFHEDHRNIAVEMATNCPARVAKIIMWITGPMVIRILHFRVEVEAGADAAAG